MAPLGAVEPPDPGAAAVGHYAPPMAFVHPEFGLRFVAGVLADGNRTERGNAAIGKFCGGGERHDRRCGEHLSRFERFKEALPRLRFGPSSSRLSAEKRARKLPIERFPVAPHSCISEQSA